MPRDEAEAEALQEACEQTIGPPGILGELVNATRYRLHSDFASVLDDLGLADVPGLAWGFTFGAFASGPTWHPVEEGGGDSDSHAFSCAAPESVAPSQSDASPKDASNDNARFAELAGLSHVAYDRQRKEAPKSLGIVRQDA